MRPASSCGIRVPHNPTDVEIVRIGNAEGCAIADRVACQRRRAAIEVHEPNRAVADGPRRVRPQLIHRAGSDSDRRIQLQPGDIDPVLHRNTGAVDPQVPTAQQVIHDARRPSAVTQVGAAREKSATVVVRQIHVRQIRIGTTLHKRAPRPPHTAVGQRQLPPVTNCHVRVDTVAGIPQVDRRSSALQPTVHENVVVVVIASQRHPRRQRQCLASVDIEIANKHIWRACVTPDCIRNYVPADIGKQVARLK